MGCFFKWVCSFNNKSIDGKYSISFIGSRNSRTHSEYICYVLHFYFSYLDFSLRWITEILSV